MKKTIIIALLSISAFGVEAQTANTASCRRLPDMPKNAVMVYPQSTYTNVGNPSCPPCYEYTTKRGLKVMECPFAMFPPENSAGDVTVPATATTSTTDMNGMDVQSQNSYTGNYPAVCPKFPDAPANAVPVWPQSAYTPTANPSCAPCYEYTTKRGLKVMECPYAQFK